ncbi:MAG: type II toxin-antitoxin system Phd/YefM family antitoxin [Blastocatellia bacterium]
MQTKTIELHGAIINFQELLAMVMAGTEIILTEDRSPVARITPIEPGETQRYPGLHPGAIQMGENFDAPLPEEFWTGQP